jgi:heparosan-N-sulfate-glucuronate 5-epimerase
MKAFRLMRKWSKMLRGKSILHVNQDEGKVYSKDDVTGYYNNLTEKVLKPGGLMDETGLVYNVTNEGKVVYFSITIFQYGLGAYDLWIMTRNPQYRVLFLRTVEWALENQLADGAWDTFSIVGAENPYSSMAQGEGASLLVRAYKDTGDDKYLAAAKNAVDFMCLSVTEGGCTHYCNEKMWFKEYIVEPVVLNGWIFSIWGLYDYYKVTKDGKYQQLLDRAIATLEKDVALFDCQYWSRYNAGNKLTSPFYHRLHIAQLKVMYDLFGCSTFNEYADKWEKYQRNRLYFCMAFLVKVSQKLTENNANKIIIVG